MNDGELQRSAAGGLRRSDGDPRGNGGRHGRPGRSDLWAYVDVLRRYWWLVALTAAVCVAGAWWSQRDDIDRYTAEVLLQQRPDAPVTSDAQGRSGGSGGVDFSSQVEIIRSRAVLTPVVDSVGLQLRVREDRQKSRFSELVASLEADRRVSGRSYELASAGDSLELRAAAGEQDTVIGRFGPEEPVTGPDFRLRVAEPGALSEPVRFSLRDRDAAVESLQGSLQIEQGRGPQLIWVRYASPDAEVSAQVVNTVARAYQSYRARTAREAAQRRRDVISEQLVELADSLRDEQAKLQEYQRSADVLNPQAQGEALVQRRFELENQMRELQYRQSLLEGVVGTLRGGDGSGDSFQRLLSTGEDLIPGASQLRSRLQELRAQRQELTASRFGHTEQSPEVQVVDSMIASTRSDIRVAAQEALDRVRQQIQQTESRLNEIRGEVDAVPERSGQYARLQQRVQAVQEVFDELVGKYYEAQIAEGVEAGDVAVVDPATVPLRPDPTHGTLNLVVALLAGLVLGGTGAAVLDHLDSSVRTARDAEQAARLDVLGMVPSISASARNSRSVLLGKEAFRGLRTNIRLRGDTEPRDMVITSPAPGEGKSTVATNLGVTYAEQGSRVILVDADLRRPQLHHLLGGPRVPGLAEHLEGRAEVDDVVVKGIDAADRLDLLPAGRKPSNAPALLDSEAFADLLDVLRSRYSAVILDTPPLLAVTDAGVVGAGVDGVLLVVRANKTDTDVVERAVDQLRRLGARLVGVVLNDVPVSGVDGRYGYAYYEDYYMAEEEAARRGGGTRLLTRSGDEKSA